MKFAVKAVMLDLDGTLVHTAPEIAAAANYMLTDLSLPQLHYEQVTNFIGNGAQALIKRCLATTLNADPDAELFGQAQALFFQYYANNVSESEPFDGVLAGLGAIQEAGYRLACVTNKPAAFTLPLLDKSGLRPYFELVVSGDTLAKKKPDPIQLHHICAEFDVLITQAVLVGDSATDIQAARAAGCYVVTVPYGYNQGRLLDESLVDATINDLTELTSLITLT